MNTDDDDEFEIINVVVTNPEGVSFPAVLGGFSNAGSVRFFIRPGDAPPGEADGERYELAKPICDMFGKPLPGCRVYKVRYPHEMRFE